MKSFRCIQECEMAFNALSCDSFSFHPSSVLSHACENISGVSWFLPRCCCSSLCTCWVMMRIFMLWQSNPIIMFRVISSPFPPQNKLKAMLSAKTFPRIYDIYQQRSRRNDANRITHLIRWKMCWIIKVNHRRTVIFWFLQEGSWSR